ncbi:MAG: NAD(P)H-dependent oxidoreductase subunit E [Defluviitaleaceae bacterium]|nr:NAD(P)H-dependent oxidoreductase subunit E [Defluviitaleaceae bacterium]
MGDVCKKEVVTADRMAKLDACLSVYKDKQGGLMPVLNESQKIFGCIPLEIQKKISGTLKIPMAEIYGVITFYHQFSIEPKGDYILSVCMGTACYVKDAQKLVDEVTEELGIVSGETTPDYKFTLMATRCVGACGLAPVVIVNDRINEKDDVYGRLEVKGGEMKDIIAKY